MFESVSHRVSFKSRSVRVGPTVRRLFPADLFAFLYLMSCLSALLCSALHCNAMQCNAGYLQQKGVSGSTKTVYEEACSEMDTINE